MKSVILAAGQGTRMGDLTKEIPKCLLKIKEKPILQYQLEALSQAGIDDVYIITGYRADKIRQFLGQAYKTIHNGEFRTTNSIYSLSLARQEICGTDFILLNGDIFVSHQAIKNLAQKEGCAALVDDRPPFVDGEMNVVIENGRIHRFSKEVKASEASGVSVQITKFGMDESVMLFDRIDQLIGAGFKNLFPAYAYDVIFQKSVMYPVMVDSQDWQEIDTPQDLEKCERIWLSP